MIRGVLFVLGVLASIIATLLIHGLIADAYMKHGQDGVEADESASITMVAIVLLVVAAIVGYKVNGGWW